MRPPSASPPGWAGEFCGPYVVNLGLQTVAFRVSREHVLGTMNLLSSLAGCGSHPTIALLFGDMSCLILLLHGFAVSKPAWFCH